MSHFTQQFLNSVLSQGGSAAPPYAEGIKWYIRQHLMHLAESYPSLQPKTATFTHNDGRAVNLLQADGTVPMDFQGVTYNIPVVFWLMESYPHHAPLVFVNPTRDMIIKRPHPFVSPNGVVSIPYIHSWAFPSSNLVELARNLSHFFARDPPLYAQRKHLDPIPNPSSNYGNMNSSVESAGARPAIPPRAYSSLPPPPYGSGRVMDDPAEVFRKNAINKLVESFNGDIREMRKAGEGEMEGSFGAQAVLRRRDEELRRGLKEMQDEKEVLEQQLQMVMMNGDILEGWLRENEGKLGGKDVNSVDVDEAFELCDAQSKQLLDCTASDLAVDDAIYALDKAVQEGAVPFDQYLRNVRLLSREQFFHRAIGSKVRAIRLQAQIGDENERSKLDIACQKWGFFQIINHGADGVLTKMKTAVDAFFDLPLFEKKKYAMATNDVQGYGQGYVVSEDQKLDWNDLLFLIALPANLRNMKYWPLTITGFKDFLKQLHGDVKQGMNYYPSCARPDLVLGVSPHSDCSSITLLMQDEDITALQIKHEGLWVPVKPIPTALVVNIGDAMEAWCNGKYKSIEHRAVTNVLKPRISVAAFVIPGNDVEMDPLKTMVDDHVQPRILKDGVKYIEYLRHTLAKKMEGKLANIEYLKLNS